jgi:hypothetical protein
MILFAIAFTAAVLGFGSGVMVADWRRKERKDPGEPKPRSSVRELMEQARWLPIASIAHKRRDESGYPTLNGQMVPIMELDGDIRLIASDRAINSAFLEYAGIRIGLSPDDREWLGGVFKDRIAELAMSSAETKLLER